MSCEKNYDELLYPILCGEGNILGFFDRVFNFLYRRTDYFKIKDDSSSMGFERGEAEKIVKSVFCKYMEKEMAQQKLEIKNKRNPVALDFVAEEVVLTTESEEVVLTTESDSNEDSSMSTAIISNDKTVVGTTNEKDTNEQSDPKFPWMDPDCYNGAKYEDYCWAQTLRDIDIRLKVPESIITGKQVEVTIQQSSLLVQIFLENKWKVLKHSDLTWKINVEESTWTLVPGEHIHVCLLKIKERWWDSFFIDEPKIDMKSIDPSIAFEDLDQESQAKIKELMYNEQQKRLGKPKIHESKIENILKEAWNTEGSPFKGQPFDPSLIDIQNAENL